MLVGDVRINDSGIKGINTDGIHTEHQIRFSPFKSNVISYPYLVDDFISNLRDVWKYVPISFKFQKIIL